MLPRNGPGRIQIAFDDHRLAANALTRTQFHRNPSLRAKRGNLVGARNATAGTRSPRRFAPRDDKVGTREGWSSVDTGDSQ